MAGQKLARHPMDFESKIGDRKPVAHNFCCKREVVAMGNQMVGPQSHDVSRATFEPPAFFPIFPMGYQIALGNLTQRM
jgi:hypothetical protein